MDPRIDKLAGVLVRYSTAVRPGDLVSLVGPPAAEPLVVALSREVLQAGGHPLVVMAPEGCREMLYRHARREQLTYCNPLEIQEVEAVDVAIHVAAPPETQPRTPDEWARSALHHQARRPLTERFRQRAAVGALRWVVTQFPCPAAAHAAGMSPAEYEDFVYAAGLLDGDDPVAAWRGVEQRQARLVERLQLVRELRFVTPQGTDLRVGVAGRTWVNGAGRQNLPDGEVYTAPIEDVTEGTLCLDSPAVHGGEEVEGVRLVFRAGRVVDATAARGEGFLLGVLDQDAGARVLGEVGLGCNRNISRFTRNALLDEKIAGTFHVALGASCLGGGGRNSSGLHWDLVCDLRSGGRVEADGQPWPPPWI